MIELTQFEYDYLMAQKNVGNFAPHFNAMINKGHFKSLDKFFETNIFGDKYIDTDTIVKLSGKFKIVPPIQCSDCSRRKWYQKGYEDGKTKLEIAWIQIEERLPELEQIVIACFDHETADDDLIEMVQFLGKIDGFGWDANQRIVAWIPLPEPYMPADEEMES